MRSEFSLAFILTAFAAAFSAPLCPDGAKPFEGTGRGATESKARENANLDIESSLSTIAVNIIDELTQKETGEDIKEEASYKRKISKTGNKLYLGYVKDAEYPYPKENGEFVAKRYICPGDVAKPYLNSLKDLARTLKAQTQKADRNSCKSINETYKSIEGLEGMLNNLARMSGEVQAEYESLKEEYQSDGRGGVFLEIKEDIFGQKSNAMGSKLREALSAGNCRIERNICKANGGFTLRINAAACNHKNDGAFDHCSACLKIDLLNGRNEIVLSPSVEAKAAWAGKAAACEKAFEQAAPEIFGKIKDKISEVCQ